MKKVNVFFKWLIDKVIYHQYWYKKPPKWMDTDKWGKTNITTSPLSGRPIVMKSIGHPVVQKQCKTCKIIFWSNNPTLVCGKLDCWQKYYNEELKCHH
jgi:hypothetical protein